MSFLIEPESHPSPSLAGVLNALETLATDMSEKVNDLSMEEIESGTTAKRQIILALNKFRQRVDGIHTLLAVAAKSLVISPPQVQVVTIQGATITITDGVLGSDKPPHILIESTSQSTFEEASNIGVGIRSADVDDTAEISVDIVPWQWEA